MSISGELVSSVDIEEAVTKIGSAWHRAAESIIETAMLIAHYDALKEGDAIKEVLIERGIMSTSVISMLKTIGKNPVLTAPENIHKLPAAYNTLWNLAKLPDLEERIEDGFVTPYLKLEEVRRWKTDDEDEGGSRKPSPTKGSIEGIKLMTFAQIRVSDDEDFAPESLRSALINLQNDFPFIEIVYSKV